MKNVLKNPVLILNSGWSPLEIRSAEHVIPMMVTGVASALDIDREANTLIPTPWDDWIALPVRRGDDAVHSQNFTMRCPTVIVTGHKKVHHRTPKKNLRGLAARDNSTCQISGKKLSPDRWSADHVLPKDRGGGDEWENLALVDREINNKKGNKTNEEAGLKLLRKPKAPKALPAACFLVGAHPDHELFLK